MRNVFAFVVAALLMAVTVAPSFAMGENQGAPSQGVSGNQGKGR